MRTRAFCRFRSTEGSVRHADVRSMVATLQMGEEDGELTVFVDRFHEEPNALRNATDRYDFRVDGVLCDASQKSVYDTAASRLVQACAQGHNATLLCHGQHRAGKSFTCFGEGDYDARGCAPRCLQELYQHMSEVHGKIEYEVRIRGLEVFGNQIRDLLEPSDERTVFSVPGNTSSFHGCAANAAKGRIGIGSRTRSDGGVAVRRTARAGVIVENATERVCASELEALEALFECVAGRTEGPLPAMRGALSGTGGGWASLGHARKALYKSDYGRGSLPRSHVVVTVTVVQRFPHSGRAGEVVESKLQFVDLASSHSCDELCGSEDAAPSGEGVGSVERMNAQVRQSLCALQHVVTALNRQKSKIHHNRKAGVSYVPYRQNATTALLQDAIGGGSVCSLVSHIRPEQYELLGEMLGTLRFAQQMSHVTSRPVMVQPASAGMKRALEVASLKRQVGQLQKELQLRSGTPSVDVLPQRSEWNHSTRKESAGEFYHALGSAVGGFLDGSSNAHRSPSADPSNAHRPASAASALSNVSSTRVAQPQPQPQPLAQPAMSADSTPQQQSRPSTASIMRRSRSPTQEGKATPQNREMESRQDTSPTSPTTQQRNTRLSLHRQPSNATRPPSQDSRQRDVVDSTAERGARIILGGTGTGAISNPLVEAASNAPKRSVEGGAPPQRTASIRNRARTSKVITELSAAQPVVVAGELEMTRGVGVGIGTPHTFAEDLFKQTPVHRKSSVRRPLESKVSALLNIERTSAASSAFSRQDTQETLPRTTPWSSTVSDEVRTPLPRAFQTTLPLAESGAVSAVPPRAPAQPRTKPPLPPSKSQAREDAAAVAVAAIADKALGNGAALTDDAAARTQTVDDSNRERNNRNTGLSSDTVLGTAAPGTSSKSSTARNPEGIRHPTGSGTCRNAAFDDYLRTSEGTIQLRELFAAQSAFISLKRRLVDQQNTVASLLAQQKELNESMSRILQMTPQRDPLELTGRRDISAVDERRQLSKREQQKSTAVSMGLRRVGTAAGTSTGAAARSKQVLPVKPSAAALMGVTPAGGDGFEVDSDEDLTDLERNERDRSLTRCAVEEETAVLLSLHSERTEAVHRLEAKQMQLLHSFEVWFFTSTGQHASPTATTLPANGMLSSGMQIGSTLTAEGQSSRSRPPSASLENGKGPQTTRPWSSPASGSRTSTRSCTTNTSPSLSLYIRRRLPVHRSGSAMGMEESMDDTSSTGVSGPLRESSTLCSEESRFDWLLQQRWRMRDPDSVVYYAAQQLAQRQIGKSAASA